jgi:hypothetical protein
VVVRRKRHGAAAKPKQSSRPATAALLIGDYFLTMAERVYGDAAATERERGAATLGCSPIGRPSYMRAISSARYGCRDCGRQSRSAPLRTC